MDNIFKIFDKTGRKIRLTKKQWSHIRVEHPEVNEEDIKKVLKKPVKIVNEISDKSYYYLHLKDRKSPDNYLRVIVRYLNGEGFVISAYFVRHMN